MRMRLDPYPNSTMISRGSIMVLAVAVLLIFIVLIVSLFRIQILNHDFYSREAAAIHYRRQIDIPERGRILDRNGLPLAVSTYEYTIGITPSALRSWDYDGPDAKGIIQALAKLLDMPEADVREAAAMEEESYVTLKKHVTREACDALKAWRSAHSIGGIVVDTVLMRSYPEKDLASSVVGFAATRDSILEGVIGVEAYYDEELRGKPGFSFEQVDNYASQELLFTEGTRQQAVPGQDIQLTIDSDLQAYCEQMLRNMVPAYDIKDGAEIVVLENKTGEILAMANHTTFDLNNPYAAPEGVKKSDWDPFSNKEQMDYVFEQLWRNRSVSMLYEPGSTFKSLTVATALEEKAVGEDETFSDEAVWVPGFIDYPISCFSGETGHGYETMYEGLMRSCNPIMVRVAMHMGIETFFSHFRAFGVMEKTGVDLPAEAEPIIHTEYDSALIDQASISFGESNTITPLHLAMAYSVFGSDGKLIRPHIVKKILNRDGSVANRIEPEFVRQAISKETADKMLYYLGGPPSDYGVSVPGYGFTGKTSTSNYEDEDGFVHDVMSFCAVSPSWDPRVTVLIVFHDSHPLMASEYDMTMNAMITERALRNLGVARSLSDSEAYALSSDYWLPDLSGMTMREAARALLPHRIQIVRQEGASWDQKVALQYPAAGSVMNENGYVYLGFNQSKREANVTVPDFVGMDYDQARRMAEQIGLNLRFSGDVRKSVSSQNVDAGSLLLPQSIVDVDLG